VLSQGSGDISYSWSAYDFPAGARLDAYGASALISYYPSYGKLHLSGDDQTMIPVPYITCTAQNAAGSSTAGAAVHFLRYGYGCPTLAFNSNGLFEDENPLLITSLSNPNIDVIDYYLINTPIQPGNDKIKLVIHEPQTEHTFLDQVELYKVKIKKDEFTAVTDEGEIVNYKKSNKRFKITLNGKTDLTNILFDLDGNKIALKPGDVLLIEKPSTTRDGEEEYMVMGGEVPHPPQKKVAGRIKDNTVSKNEKEQLLTMNNGFQLRPNLSIICKKLNNTGNTFEVNISQKINLDYLAIIKNLKTAKVTNLKIVSAVHNSDGDIKNKILFKDNIYGEILPSENIFFTFNDDNSASEKSAFIIKSVGRYSTIGNKNTSKSTSQFDKLFSYKLEQNHPNPFNPTTKIKYSIREQGLVTLKVYDLLGKEITTLINEPKEAGDYEVEFNANKYGLSSGIYLYRLVVSGANPLTSGSFTSTKKFVYLR